MAKVDMLALIKDRFYEGDGKIRDIEEGDVYTLYAYVRFAKWNNTSETRQVLETLLMIASHSDDIPRAPDDDSHLWLLESIRVVAEAALRPRHR